MEKGIPLQDSLSYRRQAGHCVPRKKVAVFIDGCFWHGCPLHGKKPTNNSDFWRKKIERNIRRDLDVNIALREQHWTVVRVWEHEVADNLDAAVSEIVTVLEA